MLEKMSMEQSPSKQEFIKEKLSWKERAGKVLRLSGLPIAFAMFLASCGGGKEKGPNNEVLQNLKEKGEVVLVSQESIDEAQEIIQKAKDEGKTTFSFDDYNTTIDVDTVENFIEYSQLVHSGTKQQYAYSKAIKLDEKTIHYNYYTGVNGSNSLMQFDADRETRVVTTAMSDEGVYNEGYGVKSDGSVVGDKKTGEKVAKDFSETIKTIKEKIGN